MILETNADCAWALCMYICMCKHVFYFVYVCVHLDGCSLYVYQALLNAYFWMLSNYKC